MTYDWHSALTCAYLLPWMVGLIYILFIWRKPKPPQSSVSSDLARMDLVICYHNESSNLQSNLRSWLEQGAISRIILVDDHSTDGGTPWLESQASPATVIPNSAPKGKKHALRVGLDASEADRFLLTDADCRPASAKWASLMNQGLNENDIVLGYSPPRASTGLLNAWCRWDAQMIAIQYFSASMYRRAYMGVGRNIAYNKSVSQAYRPTEDLVSGDDDLLIRAAARGACKISWCLARDAWTWTEAPQSWSSLWSQKRRHITTSDFYSLQERMSLWVFPSVLGMSLLVVLVSLAVGLPYVAGCSYASSSILSLVALRRWRDLSTSRDLYIWTWILWPIWLVFYFLLGLSHWIHPKRGW